MPSNPDRRPTVLDNILTFVGDHPEWVSPQSLAAARRELQVLRELCEAQWTVAEGTYSGLIADAIDRRSRAEDAYQEWRDEQEKQD